MLEILYFAIVTQDENMVIALLKVLPKEILFFDKATGDYLVSLLKHHQCKRAFDVLKSLAAKEVKASAEIKIADEVSSEAKINGVFDKMWDEICSLSSQKVSLAEFKTQFAAYDSLLAIATNYSVQKASLAEFKKQFPTYDSLMTTTATNYSAFHSMRAASVAFLLQDYAAATRHFEAGITHLRKEDPSKSIAFTPDTFVDETLTELTFRLFAAFSVKPSRQYMDLFKNNLYRSKLTLSIGQDAFLFPLTATLNYETLMAANASLTEFINFKRQLPIIQLAYRDAPDFKVAVKVQSFIIRRFYEWIVSLERQSLAISYHGQDELNNLISGMKLARLRLVCEFYGMKKVLLDIFKQCHRLLEIEYEWRYLTDFDAAVAIERAANVRLDKITIEQVVDYVGSEKSAEKTEAKSPKRKKKKPIKQEEKPLVLPTMPPKPDKPLDSYAELPTYYPDVPKFDLPGTPKLRNKTPCLFLACPDTKGGLKEQEKLAKPEVEELVVTNPPPSHFIIRQVNNDKLFSNLFYVDFVDPVNKDDFFVIHPEYYLEAIYLASKYHSVAAGVQIELDKAKTHIMDSLHQVDLSVLHAQYDTFIRRFGDTEAMKIFVKYDLCKFLIGRGIIPIIGTEPASEKNVATLQFHS